MIRYQIQRNSLAWLLVGMVAVIAPHAPRLSWWIMAVAAGCGLWRVMIWRGRWSHPGRWTKTGFVVAGFIAVPLSYGSLLGLEPAVGLLVIAFVLKLLEMATRRDALIVIFLAYFTAATVFLFEQTIPWTLYMTLALTMITAALIGQNQTRTHERPLATFRHAGVMLLQALPLMLVLFVLFPRIAPLWTVPLQSQAGRTGVTDVMRIGDISQLTQSADLAFRATFEGDVPGNDELYWRGLVLSQFRDGAWQQEDREFWSNAERRAWNRDERSVYGFRPIQFAHDMTAGWDALIERLGDRREYSIILEPTQQHWIFALATPVPVTSDIGLVRDYRLYSIKPVQSRLRYDVISWLDHRIETELSDFWRYRMTLLPAGRNPRTVAFARELRATTESDAAFVDAVLAHFREQPFVYTLTPPVLAGEDTYDAFLFDAREGFCEHYAGSFVYLMRAAGVPARVVVGYQGGEYNPRGNYVAVYQFDAHAWAEVWLPGRGWIRVDPTSAVAPERIRDGLEAAAPDAFLADSPLSWMRFRQTLWLTELRLQLSAIGHYWDTFVIGYNPTTQMQFLSRLLGDTDMTRLGIMLLGSFFSVLGVIAAVLLLRRRPEPRQPLDREYRRYCRVLAGQGLARADGEAPLDYAHRVIAARPELESGVRAVTDLYVLHRYAACGDATGGLAELRAAIRRTRLQALAINS